MKFIGQHIVDMIARFRGDVYLDSPTAGGSDPDKFLGIDSDGKIIYRTGTQVASDMGAFAYQYISFLGNATVPADGDWMTFSGNGVSNHTWTTDLGSGGTTVGSSTATIPTGAIGAGIRIPYAAVLVGFTGITNRASNHQSAVGLLLGEPTWNDFATFDCTLRAYHAADISAGPDSNYSSRPVKSEDLTRSQAVSAGQVIYPVVKDLGSNASVCKVSMTIVLKTLIP
jgi:hypothetical protein